MIHWRSPGGGHPGHPADHDQYENLVLNYANAAYLYGSGLSANGRIDGARQSFGPDEDYLTIFSGSINITTGGTYQFAVDGDDAVEVIIDGTMVAGWYGGHGQCECTDHYGTITFGAPAFIPGVSSRRDGRG